MAEQFFDNYETTLSSQNSWGDLWGVTINDCPGCCRLRLDDLAALMTTGGDCVFPRAA
jgi:hypothetical protein